MVGGGTIKLRAVGATATLHRFGHAEIVSETGGQLDIAAGASEAGFSPLDLLFSSLASCLVLSARIAASRLGLIKHFSRAVVQVTGDKSHDEPFHMERFTVRIAVEGELTQQQKVQIIHLAEEICTVSNTLKNSTNLVLVID
jgi:uncharacterized OsmC-like protein